ncbi:MAG: cytochrome ubiquinol oxidase subunit I, partial [Desulfobulbaceae bacterium]|nr:cytochrome ubiquinol oxidase subunit I [Desulfobulbaceae bacterium]
FGAPLAIEGIFAFFIEATFFAVMFFGWDRVSKKFHLFSTWMVAVGSNLSALWILVANGWMQYPVGMRFNPEAARFEMQDIGAVIFSPVAISKFAHVTSSAFLLGSLFVITVSSWFLLKGRHLEMAKKSILVASVFGLLSSAFVGFTGDEAAYTDARHQPMKLAAFEGLYDGETSAGLVAMGVMNHAKQPGDDQDPFLFAVKVPGVLSLLANREPGSFVPGINDLVYGNDEHGVEGVRDKMIRGKMALTYLAEYKTLREAGDEGGALGALAAFTPHQEYLGYGYLSRPEDAVPPVPLVFYSFHIMVVLGTVLPVICLLFLYFTYKDTVAEQKWLLAVGISSVFLAHLAHQAGWVVAEVGRQPWAIQGLLPVSVARTNLTVGTVQTTFFMFLILFTTLLIAEIRIMVKQINIGPEGN